MGDAVGVFIQLIVKIQHCTAGIAKNGIHALLTKDLHKNLRTVQLHGELLLFPKPFSCTLCRGRGEKKRPLSPVHSKRQRPCDHQALCGTTLVGALCTLSWASNKALPHNGGCRRCLQGSDTRWQAAPGGFLPRNTDCLAPNGSSLNRGDRVVLFPIHAFDDVNYTINRADVNRQFVT